MRSLVWLKLLAFGLVATLASGCQPSCQQLCEENADYVDRCLEHWEAVWADFGYSGRNNLTPRDDYIATCNRRYQSAIKVGGVEEGRVIRQRCSEDLQDLVAAVGCYEYEPNDIPLDPTTGDNGVAPPAE